MNTEPVVYIIDDDPAARESIAALIQSQDLAVMPFASAEDFLAKYDSSQRGCLIVDVRMKGMSGLDLQEQLAKQHANLPVIVITGFADVPMAVRAMRSGAVTFLEKPSGEQAISDAIHLALDQEARANELRQQRDQIEQNYASLTPAELLVLDQLMQGMPNKAIASELDLGLRTVELRRATIMKKMHADSLAELVRLVLSLRS
ncbi:MAG: response regulator [Planctomycetota bacterium]|nr:response regulator [Planctomycetota bacterium]